MDELKKLLEQMAEHFSSGVEVCPQCHGEGKIYRTERVNAYESEVVVTGICETCQGRGEVRIMKFIPEIIIPNKEADNMNEVPDREPTEPEEAEVDRQCYFCGEDIYVGEGYFFLEVAGTINVCADCMMCAKRTAGE